MLPEKTTAIVLRVVDFSETSCVVTLMTRNHGKITALAKGARRPKGPFEGALDLLAICNVVFIHKTSGAMDLLTEAKLDRRFKNSSKNLNRLYVGYYIAELLRLLTDDADPHVDAYDLAVKTLERIDDRPLILDGKPLHDSQLPESPATVESSASLGQTLVEFELGLLETLGHLPMLTKCVSCGRDKTTIERVKFGLNDGGVICSGCRPGKSDVVDLSRNAFEILLHLTHSDFASSLPASQNGGPTELGATYRSAKQLSSVIEGGSSELVRESRVDLQTPMRVESNVGQTTSESVFGELPVSLSRSLPADLTTAEGFGEVRLLVQRYVTHLIGHPPRLHAYLKNL